MVLGYSVESSYGGSTLPPSALAGWPVHLLGGPWKKQRAVLNILKDDVVSLDNNNFLKVSQFGQVVEPDGSLRLIGDVLGYPNVTNFMMVATIISLTNAYNEVVNMYGVGFDESGDREMMKEEEGYVTRDSSSLFTEDGDV